MNKAIFTATNVKATTVFVATQTQKGDDTQKGYCSNCNDDSLLTADGRCVFCGY